VTLEACKEPEGPEVSKESETRNTKVFAEHSRTYPYSTAKARNAAKMSWTLYVGVDEASETRGAFNTKASGKHSRTYPFSVAKTYNAIRIACVGVDEGICSDMLEECVLL
jgi:hypothetical protein